MWYRMCTHSGGRVWTFLIWAIIERIFDNIFCMIWYLTTYHVSLIDRFLVKVGAEAGPRVHAQMQLQLGACSRCYTEA